MPKTPVLTLLSWNVFRNYRSRRIARSLERLIETHRPEIVFIQEAPHRDQESFWDLDCLRGFHRLYAPVHEVIIRSHRFDFLSTGQLTLSRLPFEATDTYELPILPRLLERKSRAIATVVRRVPYARIRLSSGASVGLHNVHLENRVFPSGRTTQVRHLLSVVNHMQDDISIVGGDLNTFMGRALERCLRLFTRDGFTRLIGMPRLRGLPTLDYVMVRGAAVAKAVPIRAYGSDHYPVLVRFGIV